MDKTLRDAERRAASGSPEAEIKLARVQRRRGAERPTMRMQVFVTPRDCSPGCEGCKTGDSYYHDRGWYGHMGALDYFKTDHVEVVASASDNDYQGNTYALLFVEDADVYALWRDSFGSCSGCDSLIDASNEDAYAYVKATMAEGNTRQFWSVADAAEYLRTNTDYSWSSAWGNGLGEFRAEVCALAGVPADRLVEDDD